MPGGGGTCTPSAPPLPRRGGVACLCGWVGGGGVLDPGPLGGGYLIQAPASHQLPLHPGPGTTSLVCWARLPGLACHVSASTPTGPPPRLALHSAGPPRYLLSTLASWGAASTSSLRSAPAATEKPAATCGAGGWVGGWTNSGSSSGWGDGAWRPAEGMLHQH